MPEPGWEPADAPFNAVKEQLDGYFAGRRQRFDLPLAPAGTAFQRKVLEALQAIPYGETRSYKEVAAAIGKPRAVRAVGAANARKPHTHHHPLPPGDWQRRLAHRLRRGSADQARIAGPRTGCGAGLVSQAEPAPYRANVDWFIFSAGALGILIVCLPLILFPEWGKSALTRAFEAVTHGLGTLYIVMAGAVLVFLLYLAFGRFGKVVLGDGSAPDYGNFSWTSMLFCGGIGTSVLYWGTVEWAYYYNAPPFGVAPRHRRGDALGGQLPHLPLGLHRLGALLPARRRHRLRLPCAQDAGAAAQRRLQGRSRPQR